MAVQEGLGGLGGIGLDEAAVAVGEVQDKAVGLALHPADDHHCLAEVALGVARRVGQRHEHLPCLAAVLPDVVLDDGVPAIEAVLVPETLEDPLRRVTLLPGNPEVLFQDPVDDGGEGIVLSLSKGWASGVGSAAGSPAGQSRPASCAPCPGAGRTPERLPECSSPPPSPPGESADIPPRCTSMAPSAGSATTLWMTASGTVCNRRTC